MTLESQWYASIMYWLPLRDHIGKQPMSSVKTLLMGSVQIYISLDGGAGKPGGGLTGERVVLSVWWIGCLAALVIGGL
jgi:hypothetical protein